MHEFKKYFGQNFLTSKKPIIRLVSLLDIENENIIEIGPGDGRVTEEILSKNPKKLTAVEIDNDLIGFLTNKFSEFTNFKLVNADFLKTDLDEITEGKSYSAVGSLPYNVSKPIIKALIEAKSKPKALCLILQKEVAQDYTAVTPRASFLSIYASVFYELSYKGTIKKELFVPRPKVDGGIVLFKLREIPYIQSNEEYRNFAKFLKSAFLTPRKKLSSVLRSVYKEVNWQEIFEKNGLNPNARAAELNTQNFIDLFHEFKQNA